MQALTERVREWRQRGESVDFRGHPIHVFRREGEDYYSFVPMTFTGVSWCGTLPAPREKAKTIEYYVNAVDDSYQPQRTSTFRLPIKPEGVCEFPPTVEPAKAGAIKVFATNRKQGKKLDDAFALAGVTFVPLP